MDMPFSAAANAYGAARRLVEMPDGAPGQGAVPAAGGPDFGDMLTASVGELVASGRAADQKSLELVNGNSNVVDVVTAISETEIALETLVTIRDKMISAYEEIMRMPI